MKPLLIILLSIFFIKANNLKAQCSIDYTQTQPGIYPDTLPDGMVGVGFTEGITFVMPLDTSGFDFTNFYIQTVSGLPFGLSWQCNSPGTNCNYNPQTTQYGCIEIFGTPLQAGTYPIDVSIITTLNVIGDIPANFYTQVVIQPDSSSNMGFTASGTYGCSPMTVSFTNNNPGMAAYSWDFGNGTTSTQENPAPETYTSPGDYVVNYEAYPAGSSSYFLTNIEVVDADGWSGDLDDGFGALSPDPYIKLLDQSGSVIYTSPVYVDQGFPVSWPISNILLQDQSYTIEVWEEDGFWTNDDFCGSLSFQGFSTSGTLTGGGETVNYTTSVVNAGLITSSDTIRVFDTPNTPNIDFLGSELWTDSLSFLLQWYQDGTSITGATSDSLLATVSGDYFVLSSNLEGCYSSSDTVFVVVCDTALVPSITQNGNMLYTSASGFIIQWYQDGLPITGETNETLLNISEGEFFVELSSTDGCVYVSDTITVDFSSIDEGALSKASFVIYPNPTKGAFTLKLNGVGSDPLTIQVLDLSGRIVFNKEVTAINQSLEQMIRFNSLAGVYLVRVTNNNQSIQRKLVVN